MQYIQYPVHLIVNNVACRSEVDGIDDFVMSILFIAIKILGLPTVT